jgi:hypothetical protein
MQLSVVMEFVMREHFNDQGEKLSQSPGIWTKYIQATVKKSRMGIVTIGPTIGEEAVCQIGWS